MICAFEDCELDLGRFQLRRRGEAVKLEPKVYDVLAHLVARRERVVTKLELLDALWPGETLSESVLPRAIAAARRAVGDSRARARVIETVHGRGYRFVAAVKERSAAPAASAVRDATAEAPASQFLGRERVLERLDALLGAALAGGARIALLAGEPGIGKTRTAEELAARARERGALIALARCFEGEGAPALWPWRQVLRELSAACEPSAIRAALGADAAALAQIAPELGVFAAAEAPAPSGDGEQARFRLFDALAGFLRRLARHAPLVLVIDDLHWADEASLLALTFLAPELRRARMLLVGTYRDVDVRRAHPLARTLGALAREPSCERIALRGLDAGDVAALVAGIAGSSTSPQLAQTVYDLSEGNPFFVVELARVLRESAAPNDATALGLPQSVRDAVGRRLDAISPEANELLRTAAVLGRSFDLALLARLQGRGRDELLDALGEALDCGALRESDARTGQYAFSHALVRQTLYEELRAPQRVRLHRRAAEALEAATPAGAEAPLSEIAHHYFEALPAGDPGPALRAAERAAVRAHALFAYEESARLYERALDALALVAPGDALRRFELLAAAGAEHSAAGAREAARAQYRSASSVARSLGRTDLLAHAALGFRGLGEMGVPPEAETLALLEEARDALGAREPVLRARLLSKLTGTAPYSLSMASRDALSSEALALARASGDTAALRDALSAREWACFGPDRVGERLTLADELIALGEGTHDLLTQFHGYEARFGTYLLLGDAAGADAALAACVRLAAEQPYRYVVFQARFFEAARAACRGDLVATERLLAEARALGRDRTAYAELQCDAHLLWTKMQRGEREQLVPLSATLLPRIAATWRGAERVASAAMALLAVGAGEGDEARRLLAEVEGAGFATLERDEHFLLAAASTTDVVYRLGDTRRAASLYAVVSPYAHLFGCHDLLRTFSGSVSAVLGELCLALGRVDEAIARYESALAIEAKAGARASQVSSQVMLARALRTRAARGDARRATDLLRQVAATAPSLGIDWSARFGFDPETLAEHPSAPL